MGGSTCLAAKTVGERIHAIDSDPDWVAKVRQEIGNCSKEVRVNVVNIGPTGSWGYPQGKSDIDKYADYSRSITRTGFADYDLCLVDGRFRIACFLQALSVLNMDSVIGFHDYACRPQYHLVEEFARPIAGIKELKFFVRRPGLDRTALSVALEKYRNEPG